MTHNYFNICKQWLILNRIIRVGWQRLKLFNCVKTIAVVVCKKLVLI